MSYSDDEGATWKPLAQDASFALDDGCFFYNGIEEDSSSEWLTVFNSNSQVLYRIVANAQDGYKATGWEPDASEYPYMIEENVTANAKFEKLPPTTTITGTFLDELDASMPDGIEVTFIDASDNSHYGYVKNGYYTINGCTKGLRGQLSALPAQGYFPVIEDITDEQMDTDVLTYNLKTSKYCRLTGEVKDTKGQEVNVGDAEFIVGEDVYQGSIASHYLEIKVPMHTDGSLHLMADGYQDKWIDSPEGGYADTEKDIGPIILEPVPAPQITLVADPEGSGTFHNLTTREDQSTIEVEKGWYWANNKSGYFYVYGSNDESDLKGIWQSVGKDDYKFTDWDETTGDHNLKKIESSFTRTATFVKYYRVTFYADDPSTGVSGEIVSYPPDVEGQPSWSWDSKKMWADYPEGTQITDIIDRANTAELVSYQHELDGWYGKHDGTLTEASEWGANWKEVKIETVPAKAFSNDEKHLSFDGAFIERGSEQKDFSEKELNRDCEIGTRLMVNYGEQEGKIRVEYSDDKGIAWVAEFTPKAWGTGFDHLSINGEDVEPGVWFTFDGSAERYDVEIFYKEIEYVYGEVTGTLGHDKFTGQYCEGEECILIDDASLSDNVEVGTEEWVSYDHPDTINAFYAYDGSTMWDASITANPQEGYEFVHWTLNGEVLDPGVRVHFKAGNEYKLQAVYEKAVEHVVLQGTVTNKDTGKAIVGVKVTFTPNQSNDATVVYTNGLGQYKFDRLVKGQGGVLTFEKDGYILKSISLTDEQMSKDLVEDAQLSVAYKLVINYVDTDGNPVHDPYSGEYAKDDKYSVESPAIDGYELVDPSQAFVSGTMPEKDVSETVAYKAKAIPPAPPAPDVPHADKSAQTSDMMPFAIGGLALLALISIVVVYNRKKGFQK